MPASQPSLVRKLLVPGVLAALLTAMTGCRQDMHDQPKFYPQRGTSLFADGRSVRSQVSGTVARSQGEVGDYFTTGMVYGKEADGLPIELTQATLLRGQERFNIYCAPCHSRVGNGLGMIVQRGYYPAATFHSTRLRDAPLGHFFSVMTNGYGAMPNYAAELRPEDRWAVAAYIRALQLSQNAKVQDAAGQRPSPLQKIEETQGFEGGFLDAWFPKSHPRVTPAPAASVNVPTANPPSDAAANKITPINIALTAATVKALPPTALPDSSKPAQAFKKANDVSSNTHAADSTVSVAKAASTSGASAHDPAAGKMVYAHNCAGCHQLSRAGLPPNIPSLIGIVPKVGEERIRTVVSEGIPTGKPPMPAFTQLSTDDVEDLIAYLKSGS